jgi:fluoroacetyl-CoA thioesterase
MDYGEEMDLYGLIQAGMELEREYQVTAAHSAVHIGSGSQQVLATPWMITYMERTCRDLLAEKLPGGYASVGVHVDIHHLAPTPVGSLVWVQARVTRVEGLQVHFNLEARDKLEPIGKGNHTRVVIDEARFMKRVASKA